MIVWLIGIIAFIFILPSLLVTAIWAALVGGPLIVVGSCGIIAAFLSYKFATRGRMKEPKKNMKVRIKTSGKEIYVKRIVYQIISTAILAPIIIAALVLFTPPIIAIPLIFVTIGVEIGRYRSDK